jgi:hypothetical protein
VSRLSGVVGGMLALLAALLITGLLMVGVQAPEHTPVPAQQAVEVRHGQEVLSQDYEEERRQAGFAAKPGPPYPTRNWTPAGR